MKNQSCGLSGRFDRPRVGVAAIMWNIGRIFGLAGLALAVLLVPPIISELLRFGSDWEAPFFARYLIILSALSILIGVGVAGVSYVVAGLEKK